MPRKIVAKRPVRKAKVKVPMIVPSSMIKKLSGPAKHHEVLELDDEEFMKLRVKYGCPPEQK